MMRKILAVLLVICAGFGLLLCVAGLIGAWVANTPATEATTSLTATVEGYLGLAGSAPQRPAPRWMPYAPRSMRWKQMSPA
ncbi:MAG: hypothetical protein IPK16_23475 [Anaerolineales bacterium]|nr:hypothetical protein [Anaerolineales bacterium]